MAKIIIVEDEESLQLVLEYDLTLHKHDITISDNGIDAYDKIITENFDLAIIDWMIPGMNGIKLIERIRANNIDIKIIMLSAKNQELEIVKGLESGADDFVSKPFSPRELLARINVLLRTRVTNISNSITMINEYVKFDRNKRCAYVNDNVIELTKLEFELLEYFYENRNIILTRDQILNKIWGYDYEKDNRVIDVYVHSLKKKLSLKNELESKRGVGYILVV